MIAAALAAVLEIDGYIRRRRETPRSVLDGMACLRGAALNGCLRAVPGDLPAADNLVRAWIAAGGDWHDLVAAVNDRASYGARLRGDA
ncbi:MAG: hypothetical protein H7841_08390 [Magnetospirillum sp. WYHS-4]